MLFAERSERRNNQKIEPLKVFTRCYRYALDPSEDQKSAVYRAVKKARRHWNRMVASLRYAEDEIDHGRRGSIQSRLVDIFLGKKLVGAACSGKVKEQALSSGISVEAAIRLNRIEQGRRAGKLIHTKDGRFLRETSKRKLALAYAVESVEATRKKKGTCESPMAFALIQKFNDCCDLYVQCKRGKPRFKRWGDSISLQYQVTSTSINPIEGGLINLGKLVGEVGDRIPFFQHRERPKSSTIKQLALTVRGGRMYAVLMLDITEPEPQLTKTGLVAGIDPGRKVALSLSSLDDTIQESISPNLSRDSSFLRKLNRLQRKEGRQRISANPDCYDAEGRSIKGKHPKNTSRNLEKTLSEIADMQRHISDARSDFYHNVANGILNRFDVIGVGKWRGKIRKKRRNRSEQRTLKAEQRSGSKNAGHNAGIRAQARKDYDHAISTFTSILKYKSEGTHKQIFDVPEYGTTVTCSCGAKTGPTGIDGLKVREWTCSECGKVYHRDFHAAQAIAQRAAEMAVASVSQVAVRLDRTKKGRRARAQTKAFAQANNVPVGDQDTNPGSSRERCSDASEGLPARGLEVPVAEGNRNIDLGGRPCINLRKEEPLAECLPEPWNRTTYDASVASDC